MATIERVINNTLQPIMLETGVILPAAGTPEAQPKDVEITDKDRKRYVERGLLSIIEAQQSQPSSDATPGSPTPQPTQTSAQAAPKTSKTERS
jgi:hypothetical protein